MQSNVKSYAPIYGVIEIVDEGQPVTVLQNNVQMSFVEIGDIKCYIETSKLSNIENTQSDVRAELVKFAKQQLGKPYEWGAEGPNSFDCSGFVWYVYKNVMKKNLPRVSRDMANVGKVVQFTYDLLPGDLIFFDTSGDGVINHVGMYIGNATMIHASSTSTIKEAKITSSYWASRIEKMKNVIRG